MAENGRSKDLQLLADDQRIHVASASLLISAVFYAAGFGLSSILLLIGSLIGGIAFGHWIFNTANGEMLDSWKSVILSRISSIPKPEIDQNKEDTTESEKTRQMPWQGLTLAASLNESLENLLNEIVEQYVNGWYGGAISRDRAFLNEIRYQLRYAVSNLVKCIKRVDLAKFVSDRALPISMFHVTRLTEMEKKIREAANGANLPRSMIEAKMGEMMSDSHVALSGREHETEYLKQIADFLVPRLVDETRLSGRAHDDDSPLRIFGRGKNERPWPSKSMRSFLRELLTNAVLLPTFDMITQPDTINYWLILLFNDVKQERISDPIDLTPVPLLRNLTSDVPIDNVPDSLLQLKLSEILRDARLYSIFRMYLQDIRGPVHDLQFLAEATRIHESIQRKLETTSQIAYDIWQLYGQFVHESAQERVFLDENLVEQYKSAVECNDLEVLEGIIETSYQVVYNRMQQEHVVSFCQSECFLGHLCGSPPVTINELIDRDTHEKRKNAPAERTFSLSQLRARVRKALTSVSDEEEEEAMNDRDMPKNEILMNSMLVIDPQSPESQTSSNASSYVNVPSIDIISEGEESEVEVRESISASQRLEKQNETCGLILDSDARDLNNWKVNVSKVAPLKDTYTDRTIFVFVIDVERPDAKSHETKCWSIHRSFNEFYALESKLNEFHGDSLRFSALPTRKAFVNRDRPFMEQHRLIFSTFVSTLCKQKLLNRSELLLAFLSSNEEFRDSLLLSDLNPWKVVKKMPGKLSREKGQNLKPFLLKTLAVTLAPSIPERPTEVEKTRETSSMDSSCAGNGEPPQNASLATNAIYSSIYGNNFGGIVDPEKARNNAIDKGIELWTNSAFDSILLIFWQNLKSKFSWIFHLLSALRTLCNTTIDSVIRSIMETMFEKCLCVENLVYLVQHLQWSLFCNDEPLPTEQEMAMREELAKRRTLEYFQNIISHRAERFVGREHMKSVVVRLLEALQYPRMNKQLLYVLVDQLLVDVFSELNEIGHHPLL